MGFVDPAVVQNTNLNPEGSQYASQFGRNESVLVEKAVNQMIFDAAPMQFFELKLLNRFPAEEEPSDEFFFAEKEDQRKAVTTSSGAGSVAFPATQAFTVVDEANVHVNQLLVYSDNSRGTVVNLVRSSKTITVSPMNGKSLPAVISGDTLGNMGSVEADNKDGFDSYFKLEIIEKFDFIQQFTKVVRLGRTEEWKLQKSPRYADYLASQQMELVRQYQIDLSNMFWNGERGEVVLDNGDVAKTAGGVHPTMIAGNSPNATVTSATLKEGFQDMVLSSEFGEFGRTRFVYGSNEKILALGEIYKTDKTRYEPNDMIARLNLQQISIGSSNLVLVPYNRFTQSASFPSSFANRIYIIDHANITRKRMWDINMGFTLDRSNGIAKTYKEMFVEGTIGLKFNQVKSSAFLDVN